MLVQLRGIILEYAKKKKKKEHRREKEIIKEINKIENKLEHDITYIEQLDILNLELENIREDKIKGAQIRARSLKLNEGEKPSSYFLSLEKANYINKTILEIYDLKDNLIKNKEGILNAQKSFYQKLYTKGKTTELERSPLNWVTQHIQRISDETKNKLEEDITFIEIENFLFKTKNNKAPGPDGYSYEFFKIFWEDLKYLMLKTFKEYLDTKKLSDQQKMGVITCLPKQGKDRRHMKNWRPITLLNSTYKIFSGLLANRIKTTLNSIIHNDQKGFVQNRFIGENIRLIHDIMTECYENNIQGTLILVDFEKAFDTLDWSFIHTVFKLSNYGDKILNWIKILQQGSQSMISQNGFFSNAIHLERGCRQGDPVSPYIFVVCAEILGIAIRENKKIEGIEIFGYEHKISQYADDTTLIIKNCKNSLNRVLDTLKFFHGVSGLKVNIEKTKVVQLGKPGDSRMINLDNEKLELTDEFVLLGIQFNRKKLHKITDENCKLKLPKMKKILRQWKRRKLTLNGKISVFKSLISSMITHILLSLPNPSQEFIKEYEKICKNFLWGEKPPKFRQEILEYPYEMGGLQLHNLERFSSSLKVTWLRRIISTDSSWTVFALAYKIDKCWLFGNEYIELNRDKMKNMFWRDVMDSISLLRAEIRPTRDLDYLCWPLWFDQNVNLPLIQKLQKKNVNMISDVMGEFWNIMAKEVIEETKGINLNFLEYMAIHHSVSRFIQNAEKNLLNIGPFRPILLNTVFSQQKGCQNIYRKTGQYGSKILQEISQKWERDILIDIDIGEVKQSIQLFKKTTKNMYLWDIQFKVWHERVATNTRLCHMGIKNSELCAFCQQRETNVHAFVDCDRANTFWNEIKIFLQRFGYQNFRLEKNTIIFGEGNMDFFFNIVLIIGKKLIYQKREDRAAYSMIHFENMLDLERNSEETYALHNDTLDIYERKWEVYIME